MQRRLATFVIATLVGGPVAVGAHPDQSGQQGGSEPRVGVQTRVDVQQIQRDRERLRQTRGGHEERETIRRSIRLGGSGELIVSNLSGDITVTRGSGTDLQIDAVKVARGRDAEDAREMLRLMRVDINERGNRVEARAVYPSSQELSGQGRRNFNVSVIYNITAPAGTRVAVRTVSGNIKVTDIRGEIATESTSGDVVITNAERVTTAKSISGNVQILNSSSEVAFEANSISGNVTLRDVKAPRVKLGSVSGNVIIGSVQVPRIDAQSMSGDVEFESPFAKGGRYEFSSHAGTIKIVVAGGSGFEIHATSFGGSIQADASLNLKSEDDAGRRRQRSLRAIHGDGSALVDATTFSGRVILTRK